MKKKKDFKKGVLVKVKSKADTADLTKMHHLKLGKAYPILDISECRTKCGIPDCPGLIRIGGMDNVACWGYGSWFGLRLAKVTLDQILGLKLGIGSQE